MKAIKYIYGPVNSVVKAFKAGNDIIIFRFKKNEEKNAFIEELFIILFP